MIFGMMIMFKLNTFGTLFLIIFSPQIIALELTSLLNDIAIKTQRTTSFTETKTAFFLDKPLISKGILKFIAPSTLYKKTTFPAISGQRIKANELAILNPNTPLKTTTLSLYPKLEISINAIRWVLSGNIKAIQQNFIVILTGSKQNWTVQLKPQDEQLQQEITNITFNGQAKNITGFIIKRSNGDEVHTELYDAN